MQRLALPQERNATSVGLACCDVSDIPAQRIACGPQIPELLSGEIRNFSAYANRSIFRAVRQGYVAECKTQAVMQPLSGGMKDLEDRTVSSEAVERQILIEELLTMLSSIDREIYVRHLNGQTFPSIDKALSLKPRTSEYRFREAQSRIRKAFAARPPR